ncbi:unnamed protein product [Cladocopium goreaui]|uniref:Uncharacterized protein n=1 Tax=Cladocopium goreaui TaxID=2562237 RepID=A0A9P1DSS1_9DINO|nr:unnamed protein product [Cladocopium goreaui]
MSSAPEETKKTCCRDPASYLELRSDPPNVAGRRSNDMLSSQYWRIEPLQSGAWDVILIPEGPAPAVHNLTFDVFSQGSSRGGLRPVASASVLLHLSVNIPVAETSSILCIPPAPWPVGVEVTCSVVPRDVQGNEITGGERNGAANSGEWNRYQLVNGMVSNLLFLVAAVTRPR